LTVGNADGDRGCMRIQDTLRLGLLVRARRAG
jgi:hypothetical protein